MMSVRVAVSHGRKLEDLVHALQYVAAQLNNGVTQEADETCDGCFYDYKVEHTADDPNDEPEEEPADAGTFGPDAG